MSLSIPKILSDKPWLLVAAGFLGFVAVWVSFIVFAIQHQPPQVERIVLPAPALRTS